MIRQIGLLFLTLGICQSGLAQRPLAAFEICLDSRSRDVHRSLTRATEKLAQELNAELPSDAAVWIDKRALDGEPTRRAAEALAMALEVAGRRTAFVAEGDKLDDIWVCVQISTRQLAGRHQLDISCGEERYAAFHLGKDWTEGHTNSLDPEYTWISACGDWSFDSEQASDQAQQELMRGLRQQIASSGHTGQCPPSADLAHLLTDTRILRDESVEKKARPYGTQYRHHSLIGIPEPLVVQWRSELAGRVWTNRTRRALVTVFAFAVLITSVWAVYRLDRITRGYRRIHLALGFLGTLCAITWLWQTMFTWSQ